MRILNRVSAPTGNGLEYEVGQAHAEILVRAMGTDEARKGVVTPGVSTTDGGQFGEVLVGGESRKLVESGGGERQVLGSGPDRHAFRSQGDQ